MRSENEDWEDGSEISGGRERVEIVWFCVVRQERNEGDGGAFSFLGV